MKKKITCGRSLSYLSVSDYIFDLEPSWTWMCEFEVVILVILTCEEGLSSSSVKPYIQHVQMHAFFHQAGLPVGFI